MVKVDKPTVEDLPAIGRILRLWTEESEVEKYLERVRNEISGKRRFNLQFWVVRKEKTVIGVIGLADPVPKALPLAKTKKPVEMKLLYVAGDYQAKGVGRRLVDFVEAEAKKQGYTELMVRSAQRYRETAWGFYDKLGYARVGQAPGGTELKMMQVFSKKLN